MELNFVQIQVIYSDMGGIFMYGLDAEGKVWFKTHSDNEWKKVSMFFKS